MKKENWINQTNQKKSWHLCKRIQTLLCITCGSIVGSMSMAFLTASTMSLGSGSARTIMSSGRTWHIQERLANEYAR